MANLSKIKREKMLEYLEKLKVQNNNDENIRAITEIENVLNEKKYGLVWEEHSEKVDEELIHNIPIFVEDEERKITVDEKLPYNFLLEGDNLHSLKLLEKTHKGKIDVIYIDPPYNTGNKDFIYDDSFVDKTDGYAHSKWLSFMEKRILIARELLSDDGFIFLSIDDNEVFQLKLLCDGIFGENNFIVSLPRQTKKSGKTTGSFSKNHDYVLVYSKGSLVNFKMKSHIDKEYKYKDEFFEERGLYKLNQTLDYDSLSYSKSLDYPLEIEGEIFYPGSSEKLWKMRQSGKYNRADWAWRWSRSLFNFAYKNGFVVIKRKKDGSARIYTKTYANVNIEKTNTDGYKIVSQDRTKATSSIEFTENIYSNDNAKKDLKIVGLEKSFDYSKPISLVKEIIDFHRDKDIVVLDFFAGSGTTGHAVMQLNKEDGGNRKYILCTNNENNICEEVTYQRLKNIQEELPHNLKYYKTDFIPKFSYDEESISEKMMEHIRELIELEYVIELDSKKYIILDDEDKLDEIISKIENDGKLFVRSGIFLSRRNQRILEERGVSTIEIPEYYFRDELKEVGEL